MSVLEVVRRVVFLAVVIGGLVALHLFHAPRETFTVSGTLQGREVRVGSRVGGRVARVQVREGDKVKKDQPLVDLEPFDLLPRLKEVEGQLAAQRATLARLEAGFRTEEVAQAKAHRDQAQSVVDEAVAGPRPLQIRQSEESLKLALSELGLATTSHARARELRAKQAVPQEELDRAQSQLEIATARVETQRTALELLKEGTRPEAIAQARAQLAEAQAVLDLRQKGARVEEIAQAKAQVDQALAAIERTQALMNELVVRSPCECRVEALDLRPGDLVAANAPLVTLLERENLRVRSFVPQTHLDKVQPGRELSVQVDSLPTKDFVGKVSYVAHEAEFTPANVQTPDERSQQVFRFEVELPDDPALRPGMTGDIDLRGVTGR